MLWIIILTIVLSLAYAFYKINSAYKYWENKGVPYVKPWLVFGSISSFIFRKVSLSELVTNLYKSHPGKRYVGFYQILEPILVVRDIELIKQITVKEFESFPEHRLFVPRKVDPFWDKNIFAMKGGREWHEMRSKLSPSFTTAKLKMMFGLIHQCAKEVANYFQQQCSKDSIAIVEMKDTFSRYGTDVIVTTALGVTCNSFKDKTNLFYTMGKAVAMFTGFKRFMFISYSISPVLMKLFQIGVLDHKACNFFQNVVDETVEKREKNGIVRPDMVHLLMEAKKEFRNKENQNMNDQSPTTTEEPSASEKMKKSPGLEVTNEDITANALSFFNAGFDTTSTLMCYVCYELALNPDIQERQFQEISQTLAKFEGEITYDTLSEMKYLDMVISETLRKWPGAEVTDRKLVKSFTIEAKSPDEVPLLLEPGTDIWIPTFGIQRDPEHYPDPEKFDPERFSEENKKNMNPFTYLPFGAGPRTCIGSRFALFITKIVMFELLRKFEIIPVERTQVPLVLSKGDFILLTEKGIWLGFKLRKQ